MATNSTLLQQAFELRKANPNMTVGDAVSQVKANTTPAPVTPLPTTPQTPLPTAKAGDVVVGVNGEKFVQANNQDLSTNVTGPSQVVNQSGQDMSKLEQVQAQAFGRREGLQTQGVMPTKTGQSEQDINKQYGGFIQDNGINNVQPLASKPVAPTPTTTPTTKTTPVQVQPTDENSIMTVLKTNGPITDEIKNSPSYTQVKQVYDKVKQFSTYSVNNLVTALNNGAILPGTKVYNEMLNDPALRQKLTEAQVFTAKQPVNTQAVTQSVSNEILANNPTTAGAFADGTLTPDEYSKLTNTPEVIAKASDVEAKTNKYNTLKAEYDDIETQVNKDFAGSPFADAIIADRQKAKYKNLVLAKGELDSAIGTLTELKSTAANIFETNLKLYQDQRQQDNAYKMAQYQAQLSKDAAQYQNQLQQGNFKLQNQYDLQKMGIANEYDMQKLGASNQYDMQKFAASNKFDLQKLGISNQQDLQKLALQYNMKNTGDIQSARIDLMGKGATPEQADSIIRNATGNWKGASGEVLLGAVDGTIIPTRLSQTTNPNGGKECAEYVNDITGAGLGSTWESKQAKIDTNITTPKAGDTAIWIPDPSNKQFAQYGHAGVVMGSDGTNVTIKSSNLNGQGEISTITVPIEQIKQTGGFANTAIKGQGKSEYSDIAEQVISSGTFTKDQSNNIRNAIKNGENPKAVILNQAKNLMTAADKSNTQGIEQALGQMTSLQSALQKYYDAGGNTSLLSGKYEQVINKLGEVNDPKLVTLATQIQRALQAYRKNITGTAYGIQEGADIEKVFPGISKGKGLNDAITQGNILSMKDDVDNAYRSVLYGAYDKLNQKETTTTNLADQIKETINNIVPNSYKKYFQ